MATIRLVSLRKTFEYRGQRVRAVDGVTLEVPQGKILTLLGPSGCGKTTILRCIAGLERPDEGEIWFGDRLVFGWSQGLDVPPERRNIGMVFQSYAIWPHMSVFENVAYPLRVRRVSGRELRQRVERALELVGLAALADRPAPLLSGGQQQRVALARALVYEPQVLLLDEPLSNLDAKVREQLREELRTLQRKLQITTVYVTHDQVEALSLSDVVAVMHEGRVAEVGSPQQLYARPRTRFVAQFVGTTNLLEGQVVGREGGLLLVGTPCGLLRVREDTASKAPSIPERVWLSVRPEHVRMRSDGAGAPNFLQGVVASALFEGTYTRYRISLARGQVAWTVYGQPGWAAGDTVYLEVDPGQAVVLREESGSSQAVGSPEGELVEQRR